MNDSPTQTQFQGGSRNCNGPVLGEQGGDMLSRSRSLPLHFSVPTISFLPTERMQEVVNVNVHVVQGAVDLFTPLT